ncbi:MAG: hypothetical protein QXW39_03760 [Candidatus Bathyarchaeia archaeon]
MFDEGSRALGAPPELLKLWGLGGAPNAPKGGAGPRPMRGRRGEAMKSTYVRAEPL